MTYGDPPVADPVVVWIVGFLAAAAVAAGLWVVLRSTFDQPLFVRRNHRGREVPVGAGIVLFLTVTAVTGVWRLVDSAFGWIDPGADARLWAVVVAGGFGLLGLFDDLAARGDDRGFRGHLGALAQGRLTTGGVKLLGGGLLALAVVPLSDGFVWWRILLGAAVVALAANTANLFDRAPARCTKVVVVCAIVLFAACGSWDRPLLAGVAIGVGAAVGLVFFDAREHLMLGDAGSNVAGALLGWGLVATTGWAAQVIVLAVLLVLNLASEKVSFSRVIDDTPLLRAIDRFGRPAPDDPGQ